MTGSSNPATFPAPGWRKSTHSGENNCVELARLPGGGIALRNSRIPSQEILLFTGAEIDAFFRGVKDGEFDDLIS